MIAGSFIHCRLLVQNVRYHAGVKERVVLDATKARQAASHPDRIQWFCGKVAGDLMKQAST
jgi:hypothetical protein